MSSPNVEDFKIFGNTWIYCSQHRRVHSTGWCTVSIRDKVGLGISNTGEKSELEAIKKATQLGLGGA